MSGPAKQTDPGLRARFKAAGNLPVIVGLLWDAAPSTMVWGLVWRTLAALLPLGVLALAKYIVDGIAICITQKSSPGPHFWWLVGSEFLLASLLAIIARLIEYTDTVHTERYLRHVSILVMKQAARLDLATHEQPGFHDALERARAQSTGQVFMIMALGRVVQLTISGIALVVGVAVFSPWVILLLVGCLLPSFVSESHLALKSYKLAYAQTPARRELEYVRMIGANIENAKELKMFGLSPFLTQRYSDLATRLLEDKLALGVGFLIARSLLAFLATAGYYSAYGLVIYQTVHGKLTIGTFTFLCAAIMAISRTLQDLFYQLSGIINQSLFTVDLIQFFELKSQLTSPPNARMVPRPIQQGFEFRNVSFSYGGSSRLILDDVSFRIAPGERIALIGENGEGKTTLVKLLMRLYAPTSGQILLDGHDLSEYDLDDLRNEMGVIFQDFVRYHMTTSDNIAMGRVARREDHAAIELAAQKSLADQVIAKLPQSYGQMLGKTFDGGVELSGGEWQKIALARAYLRDSQLLVLDEPTAALDARSEVEVFQRFAELTKGKMAILISHRFSTVKMADRILVLEKGRIAEDGPHADLLSRKGRYSEMYEMQAASYR